MRSHHHKSIIAVGILLAVGLPRGEALARESSEKATPPVIRVTAEATVTAAPDQAWIDIGVLTQAKEAKTAGAENAQKLDAVRRAVHKLLSSETEMQTIGYSVQPSYRYPKEGGRPEIVGYSTNHVLRVKTSQLDRVGPVLDTATQAGSNQIRRLQFRLKREEAVRAEALRRAAAMARAKAEAIASALDLRVVRVLRAEESAPTPQMMRAGQMSMMAESARVPTPVEPGTIDVTARVSLTVEVAP